VTARSGWIYPTSIGYIQHDQNQQSWIQNLRAKTLRFEDPMCFEAWKMSERHQGTKIEENQARSKSRKNRTIQFDKPEYPVFLEQIEFE
jgi:outer membrane biogenesis lipoprotein LolB